MTNIYESFYSPNLSSQSTSYLELNTYDLVQQFKPNGLSVAKSIGFAYKIAASWETLVSKDKLRIIK